MKKIIIITGIVLLMLSLSTRSTAQIHIKVQIGAPPAWAPPAPPSVRYYYLPEVESYYDVQSSSFIYLNNGRWVHMKSLPTRYRNYDLYHGQRIVLEDYHGTTPYTNYREHKIKYNYSPREIDRSNNGNWTDKKEDKRNNEGREKGHGHEHGRGQRKG